MLRLSAARVMRDGPAARAAPVALRGSALARRVAAVEMVALRRAEALLDDARAEAEAIRVAARRAADSERLTALEDARTLALCEVAGALARAAEREHAADAAALERSIELARVIAERLLGETLRLEPIRVRSLARTALDEATGARAVRLAAHPEDARALRAALPGGEARALSIVEDPRLARGDLLLETDVGVVQARLGDRVRRLCERLGESLAR